uniref:SPXN protein n=1 Tax=Macrostomum lignano TaxID=282301 RepID=A0A1I8GBX2_9PLAT
SPPPALPSLGFLLIFPNTRLEQLEIQLGMPRLALLTCLLAALCASTLLALPPARALPAESAEPWMQGKRWWPVKYTFEEADQPKEPPFRNGDGGRETRGGRLRWEDLE